MHPRLTLLFCLFFLTNVRADPIPTGIHCSHPMVCTFIEKLAPEITPHIDPSLMNLSDPHHAQISFGQLKDLLKAKILVTPAPALQPWIEKVIKMRDKKQRATLSLKVSESSHSNILSHFWLYPEQIKNNATRIKNFFKNKTDKTLSYNLEKLDSELDEIKSQLNFEIQKHKSLTSLPIILTHDALSLLFEKHGLETLILSGSTHGETFGTQKLKKLKKTINKYPKNPLVWIVETQLQVASNTTRHIRSFDHTLMLNTSGHGEAPPKLLGALSSIVDFLREANNSLAARKEKL